MRSRHLLDVVVRESTAVLEMLASENETLVTKGVFFNGEEGRLGMGMTTSKSHGGLGLS